MTKEELAQTFRAHLDANRNPAPSVENLTDVENTTKKPDIYRAIAHFVLELDSLEEVTKPQRLLMKYRLLGYMYGYKDMIKEVFEGVELTSEQDALVQEIVALAVP